MFLCSWSAIHIPTPLGVFFISTFSSPWWGLRRGIAELNLVGTQRLGFACDTHPATCSGRYIHGVLCVNERGYGCIHACVHRLAWTSVSPSRSHGDPPGFCTHGSAARTMTRMFKVKPQRWRLGEVVSEKP